MSNPFVKAIFARPPAGGGVDSRPRFGVAAGNAYTTPGTLLAALAPIAGSSNDGKAGTFNLTTTNGTFGWVAVQGTISSAGVRFFDGVGYGGWSGAGLAGNNNGASDDPSTSTVTYTDGNGTLWRFFRQDYVNANSSASSYTIS